MIIEKKLPSGDIELVDDQTNEIVARKYFLKSAKTSVLCSEHFIKDDVIEVLLPASIGIDEGKAEGGPWDGCSSKWIKNNAIEIREIKTGVLIYRAPYAKRFLGQSNSQTRYQALKSLLRRFMEGGAYGR